ncbi:unnamed protein product [Dicrocoelium dendriticum]|nr:unnamed protein product [Dicrocoelium dendriticum]
MRLRFQSACSNNKWLFSGMSNTISCMCTVLILIHSCFGAIACNQMPYHEFPDSYPNIPNSNASYRQIWFDHTLPINETFIRWRLKHTAKVSYFKIHDLQTGEVYFECALGPPGPGECCIQNTGLDQLNESEQCEQRVFNLEFLTHEYHFVYQSRGARRPNWKRSIVNAFVFTPAGWRRYFFSWPSNLDRLVCPELARVGHAASMDNIAHAISKVETHTLTYDTFLDHEVQLNADEPLLLSVRSFTNVPTQATRVYVFGYDEASGKFDVSIEEPIRSVGMQPVVQYFTERIQLVSDYVSHMRQHEFKITIERKHRALVIIACDCCHEGEDMLFTLMYEWIVRNNKSATFQWTCFTSPGIRAVRVNAVPYTVLRINEHVRIPLSLKSNLSVTCRRVRTLGSGSEVAHRLKYSSGLEGLVLSNATVLDSGMYTCTVAHHRNTLIRDHWVIVLPGRGDVHLRFIRTMAELNTTEPAEKARSQVNEVLLFTEVAPLVVCSFNLSASYDNYDGVDLVDALTREDDFEKVQLIRKEERLEGEMKHITTVYSINPSPVGETMNEHTLSCIFEYKPKVGMVRADIFSFTGDRAIRSQRRLFYTNSIQPQIITAQIQTNMTELTKSLRSERAASRRIIALLANRIAMPLVTATVTGEFAAIHLDPGGWAHVWTISDNGHEDCITSGTALTVKHRFSRVNHGGFRRPVYNRMWSYQFSCVLRPLTRALILNVFNAVREDINKPELTEQYQITVGSLFNQYSGANLTQVGYMFLNDTIQTTTSHRIANMNIRSVATGDRTHPVLLQGHEYSTTPRLFDNFIHAGQWKWRAVDFHASGPRKHLLEQTANLSFVLHLGKPEGSTFMCTHTADSKTHTTSAEICPQVSNHLVQWESDFVVKENFDSRLSWSNVTYTCSIRAETVSLMICVIQPATPSSTDLRTEVMKTMGNRIKFWMKNPRNKDYGTMLQYEQPTLIVCRIQRVRSGWTASVKVGQYWSMLLPPQHDKHLHCFRTSADGQKPQQVWYAYVTAVVAYKSPSPAKAGDTGTYHCSMSACKVGCPRQMLGYARRLLVLPTVWSMSMYYSQVKLSVDKEDSWEEQQSENELLHGQVGYVYCRSDPFPGWPGLTSLQLRLTAESADRGRTSKQLPVGRLATINSNLAIFTVSMDRPRPKYTHLIAQCILTVDSNMLDEIDLRRGEQIDPITRNLTIRLKYEYPFDIFSEVIHTKDLRMRDILIRTPPNIRSRAEFDISPIYTFESGGLHKVSMIVALGTLGGHVIVQLYAKNNITNELQEDPCTIYSAVKLTTDNVPEIIRPYFSDLHKAVLMNISFGCEVSSHHVALAVMAHTNDSSEGLIREAMFRRLLLWTSDKSIGSTAPVSGHLPQNNGRVSPDTLSRQHIASVLMRMSHQMSDFDLDDDDDEPPPVSFDEDVFVYPSMHEFERRNCG